MPLFCRIPQPPVEMHQFFSNRHPKPEGVLQDEEYYTWYVVTIHKQRVYLVDGDWVAKEPDGVHFYPIKDHIHKMMFREVHNANMTFRIEKVIYREAFDYTSNDKYIKCSEMYFYVLQMKVTGEHKPLVIYFCQDPNKMSRDRMWSSRRKSYRFLTKSSVIDAMHELRTKFNYCGLFITEVK